MGGWEGTEWFGVIEAGEEGGVCLTAPAAATTVIWYLRRSDQPEGAYMARLISTEFY